MTGRSRAVLKDYGLSRLMLKEMVNLKNLPGFKKASW